MSAEPGVTDGAAERVRAVLAELPPVEVASVPEVLVLDGDEGPIGWAVVLPEGDIWIIRDSPRVLTHCSDVSVLVSFWAAVFDCEVGRPTVRR
ncbi:hypothetical protein [Micromonospora yangpuensis]|uniref:Uncharacterized protein n=1 Tax=Micromonospora yangpuensis TaxID=683228 RepID=A0A1C6U1W8_9ACTN|nr:hypothetical protein [Micromonospora yangpuensis]GGM10763.1 hypothetical protein GCM10012279_30990 [Micromonospora yangpuensis]SCL47997.1 hypothetical protein GA0070617_0744 [Micromonospora yangpuensis]